MPRPLLLTSPSPRALENELVARVVAAAGEPGARVAVIVPTSLLAERAQRRLARARGDSGAVVGVEILHHRRLASRLLDLAFLLGLTGQGAPRLLGSIESDALVRAALARLPPSLALVRLAHDRPRVTQSLGRTLAELREAGVTPDHAREILGARDPLTLLAREHEALLSRLEADRGVTDPAGHARAAARAARALGEAGRLPWTHLLHHGSYELVGCQAELVEAVTQHVPSTVLAPCGDGPAHAASRRALARWPGEQATRLAGDGNDEQALFDLDALFDETRVARAPGQPRLEALHCRGTRTELESAARLAAEAHLERGVPLEEIAVIARSLEPMAGHLEAAFAAQGVPFMTTASVPLLREPWGQAADALLQVLTDDLPRAAVAELLRSPWVRLDDKADPAALAPDLWDAWSLEARVVRGAAAFTEDLLAWHRANVADRAGREDRAVAEVSAEAWVADRLARIEALGRVVAALDADARAWARCQTPDEHAAFLRELAARWLAEPGPEDGSALAARATFAAALDELEGLAALNELASPAGRSARGAAALTPQSARALVAGALAAGALPLGRRDGSGVRVLSAMPARSLPFREVILVGLNQGAFPRRPRQDPFLRDGDRARLRARARALQVKAESRDEERQILALLLGAATERVAVLWQRANDEGKARAASPFLREIARMALGKPQLDALTARRPGQAELDARLPLVALPGHPADAARAWRERTGRAPFRDAVLEASERARRRAAVESLARQTGRLDDALAEALATVGLLDDFEPAKTESARAEQAAHDGVLGPWPSLVPEALSATSLEMLGQCGLRWLYERGLSVRALEEEPEEGAVAAADLGTLVHGALEDVGGAAIERGGDPAWLASREGLALLRARWTARVQSLAGSRLEHAPIAWDALSQRWLTLLEAFVRADAARLAGQGLQLIAVEQDMEAVVEIDSPLGAFTWRLRGRVDRVLAGASGWRIEDYKTKADVKVFDTPASVLKGLRLQGVIYELLGRRWAETAAHPLSAHEGGVQVAFLPVHPEAESFEPVEATVLGKHRESCFETLAVLEGALATGAFAMKSSQACDWCALRAGCRHGHVPTVERQHLMPEILDQLALAKKSSKVPTLAQARETVALRADDEDDA